MKRMETEVREQGKQNEDRYEREGLKERKDDTEKEGRRESRESGWRMKVKEETEERTYV